MRLSRFLLIAALITMGALGYVQQQVELLKINYTINNNKNNLALLLDQRSTLMYNVVSFQAPFYLEQTLEAAEDNWEVPFRWQTIGFAEAAR